MTELEKIITAYGMFEEDAVTEEYCEGENTEIEWPIKTKGRPEAKEEQE